MRIESVGMEAVNVHCAGKARNSHILGYIALGNELYMDSAIEINITTVKWKCDGEGKHIYFVHRVVFFNAGMRFAVIALRSVLA